MDRSLLLNAISEDADLLKSLLKLIEVRIVFLRVKGQVIYFFVKTKSYLRNVFTSINKTKKKYHLRNIFFFFCNYEKVDDIPLRYIFIKLQKLIFVSAKLTGQHLTLRLWLRGVFISLRDIFFSKKESLKQRSFDLQRSE